MKKKNLFQNLAYIILGSIVAVSLSYAVHADTFVDGSNPPSNNTPFPLNVGAEDQIKAGGLAVNAFLANANAELDGNTFFEGGMYADPSNTNATIDFGGQDPVDTSLIRTTSLAINGGFGDTGNISSTTLVSGGTSPICADKNGNVVLCSQTDLCNNIAGVQTVVPAGDVRNGDGSCTIQQKYFYSTTSGISGQTASYFVGHVIDGDITYQKQTSLSGENSPAYGSSYSTPMIPWVDTIGLNNDFPYAWKTDTIEGVQPTSLSEAGGSRLLTVSEPGSYDIKISSQGQVGIKGKFNGDNNTLAVTFYMVLNQGQPSQQWIPLSTASTNHSNFTNGFTHFYAEPYPNSGSQLINYVADDASTSHGNSGSDQSGGASYVYAPYNFNFEKTMSLNPGDTIDVYAVFFGTSHDTGIFGGTGNIGASANNFYYSITDGGTVFDITETPQ